MLETPLYGKFYREDTKLVFAAPLPYHVLVRLCIGGGTLMCVYGLLSPYTPIYPVWWMVVGLLVIVAGVLAALSLQSVTFDLRERFYVRRQGPGLFPKMMRGPLSDLDAIVLIAEPDPLMIHRGVTYHLVLHWKGQRQPPMVLQQDTRQVPQGQPMNIASQQLLMRGVRYSKALGLPFYDNSHFASKCPVAVWR
jgi:hypothetical protein